MAFKFPFKTEDQKLNSLLREIENKLAEKSVVDGKAVKTTSFLRQEPRLTEMSDGDDKVYFDGADYYLYKRVGGKLFKTQLTVVA